MAITKEDVEEIVEERIDSQIQELSSKMDQMMEYINRDSKLQYLNALARTLESEARERIDGFNCGYHENMEKMCKNDLKSKMSRYTDALSSGDLASAFNILSQIQEQAEKADERFPEGSKCIDDWEQIGSIVKRHREIAKGISAQFTHGKVPADAGEITFEVDQLYDEFVFPLSHELRLKIVHGLVNGPQRFTQLKDELEVKNTGLLVHHLKPLSESGIIDQNYKKEYMLTERGYTIVRHLSQINALFEENDELITLETTSPNVQVQEE